jgi:hypothetical protein
VRRSAIGRGGDRACSAAGCSANGLLSYTQGDTALDRRPLGWSAANDRSIARSTLRLVMSYSEVSLLRGLARQFSATGGRRQQICCAN